MRPTRLALAVVAALISPAATADERIEDVLGATFRLDGGDASGTCFLVKAGDAMVLVTAAHVLERSTGEEANLILRERKPDGTYGRRETKIRVRDGARALWRRHPVEDVAALKIALPDGVAVTPFRLSQLADEADVTAGRVRVAQEIWIPTYPAQLEANAAGWPVLRRGTIATHPLKPVREVKTFLVDAATFGGDSGAPVVVHSGASAEEPDGSEPMVVGLILGMHRQTDRSTMPFEEKTTHMPLGLAIVLQAPFAREVVEAESR